MTQQLLNSIKQFTGGRLPQETEKQIMANCYGTMPKQEQTIAAKSQPMPPQGPAAPTMPNQI